SEATPPALVTDRRPSPFNGSQQTAGFSERAQTPAPGSITTGTGSAALPPAVSSIAGSSVALQALGERLFGGQHPSRTVEHTRRDGEHWLPGMAAAAVPLPCRGCFGRWCWRVRLCAQ